MITLDLTNILSTTLGDANNSVLITLGNVLTGMQEGSQANQLQQSGFCSLPPNAVPGVSASEALVARGVTNRPLVIAQRDVVSQALYANMSPGDAIMYGAGPTGTGQARVKTKGDGTVTLMTTTTNDETGTTVAMTVSPTAWTFFAPWGKFVFDVTGVHYTLASGASFHMGNLSLGGLAIPGINLNNYCQINSDLINVSGSTVKLGKSVAYLPMVLAPTPSLTPGSPAPSPVVVPVTGQGITSTSVMVGI